MVETLLVRVVETFVVQRVGQCRFCMVGVP